MLTQKQKAQIAATLAKQELRRAKRKDFIDKQKNKQPMTDLQFITIILLLIGTIIFLLAGIFSAQPNHTLQALRVFNARLESITSELRQYRCQEECQDITSPDERYFCEEQCKEKASGRSNSAD